MSSRTDLAHKAAAPARVACFVITVSDTRTAETDVNAKWLREAITTLGHDVTAYRLIKDEPDQVAAVLDELAGTSAGTTVSVVGC